MSFKDFRWSLLTLVGLVVLLAGCKSAPSASTPPPPELAAVATHLSAPSQTTSSAGTTLDYDITLGFEEARQQLEPSLTSAGWKPYKPRLSQTAKVALFENKSKGNYLLACEAPSWKVRLTHVERP